MFIKKVKSITRLAKKMKEVTSPTTGNERIYNRFCSRLNEILQTNLCSWIWQCWKNRSIYFKDTATKNEQRWMKTSTINIPLKKIESVT